MLYAGFRLGWGNCFRCLFAPALEIRLFLCGQAVRILDI